jgi:hypothetical protein
MVPRGSVRRFTMRPDDSPFLALLGYAYLGAVMIGSYFVATLVDQEWFCFVWLSLRWFR